MGEDGHLWSAEGTPKPAWGVRVGLLRESPLFLSLNETMLRKCLANGWLYICELY